MPCGLVFREVIFLRSEPCVCVSGFFDGCLPLNALLSTSTFNNTMRGEAANKVCLSTAKHHKLNSSIH